MFNYILAGMPPMPGMGRGGPPPMPTNNMRGPPPMMRGK